VHASHFRPGVARLTAAALLGASALALAGNAQASEADFYTGKRIAIYVGNHPGGGYDAYTRLLSRNIGRHIPGKPWSIVRNMPGAASIRLANYLYNSAKKDGMEIGGFASSSASAPLFGVNAVNILNA
jgi:tripartite-type tricarboxylate transporter receptor subunit TctC